jgi:CHAT domain/SIR2-like domain
MIEYVNLRLILKRNNSDKPGCYQARLVDTEDLLVTFSLNDDINKELSNPGDLEKVGKQLYECIFNEKLKEKFNEAFTENQQNYNKEKRVRLQLDIQDTGLIRVPWELFHDGKQFLTRKRVSIVRYDKDGDKNELNINQNQMKVLIVSAAPENYASFNEDEFTDSLLNIFQTHQISCEILKQATQEDLKEKRRNKEKYDLFNFVGHGVFEENNSGIFLIADKNSKSPALFSASELGTLLKDLNVKLACFCSCQTGKTSSENKYRGVAQNLIGQNVPVVLAMQGDISQVIGKNFFEQFYRQLLEPNNEYIIDEAIDRYEIDCNAPDWFFPVLYAQYSVGKLFGSPSDPIAIKDIVKDILNEDKKKTIIPFLGSGTNPLFYINLSNKLEEMVRQKIKDKSGKNGEEGELSKKFILKDVIGLPCSTCHYFVKERTKTEESTHLDICPMIDGIGNKEKDEQDLIVAKNYIRCLSQYLFDQRPSDFYSDLRKQCPDICKQSPGENRKQIHKFFAEIKNHVQPPFPLIVTTCYDDWLEKEFQEYDRDIIFYEPNGNNGGDFYHKSNGESIDNAQPIRNYKKLHSIMTRNENGREHLIILQLFGRWDRNFVITDGQFNSLAKSLDKLVKDKLSKIIPSICQHRHSLFIGYNPNDCEIHDLIYAFKELLSLKDDRSAWLISQSSDSNFGERLLKNSHINLLNISSWEQFIEDIKVQIEE